MLNLRLLCCHSRNNMSFYAVRRGKQQGIFSDWNSCREQVHGFPGAVFKKFKSQVEAQRFIEGDNIGTGYGKIEASKYFDSSNQGSTSHSNRFHPYSNTVSSTSVVNYGKDLGSTRTTLRNGINNLASQVKVLNKQLENIQKHRNQRTTLYTKPHSQRTYSTSSSGNDESTKSHSVVYTDGSCIDNGTNRARAGIGVYWAKDHPSNVAERLPGRPTNNRAEIHAARKAINQAKEMGLQSLTVKTDSQFLINSVTKWMPNWKHNGWKLASNKTVINKDDFEELDRDMQGIKVTWVHVRGHQGDVGNEEADRLANEGAEKTH